MSTRPSRALSERRDAGQRAGGREADAAAVDHRRPRDHARLARRRRTTTRPATSARSRSSAATSTCRRAGRWRSNETGQSNLKVHADCPSLEEIGKLVGSADRPASAKIDATVTGNKRELKATGTLVGDGVKYGDNGALTVSSNFTAKVPELTIADANVVADTHATFVSVAGPEHQRARREDDLQAEAARLRRDRQAAAALARRRRRRSCCIRIIRKSTCSGSGCRRRGRRGSWRRARRRRSTTRHDAVAVDSLTLANGDQQIAADGTFGRAGRRAEGDADQRRSRERRRAAAASAAAHRHAQRRRRIVSGTTGRAGRERGASASTRAASSSSATTRSAAPCTTRAPASRSTPSCSRTRRPT